MNTEPIPIRPEISRAAASRRSVAVPRVVVAGDASLAERVGAAVGGSVEVRSVPGLLAAMGELAAWADQAERDGGSLAMGAGDRLVCDAACLVGMERSGLAAVRELGLRSEVVVVGGDAGSTDPLAALGGCTLLSESAGHASIARALGIAPDSRPCPEPIDRAEVGSTAGLPLASGGSPSVLDTPDDLRLSEDSGDAALLDAVLNIGAEGAQRAPRIALDLMRRRSGIDGVSFAVAGHGQVPDGHASAEVSHGGEVFGHLHTLGDLAELSTLEDTLKPWAAWLARWIALDQQTRRLRDLAMRDELTGVWNRRYFDRFLRRLIDRAGGDRRQVTLMVFDIDDFKRYNDAHGHAAGDEILQATAQLMQSVVRDHDVVARIGGDEFAVIFWDAERPREEGSSHPDDVANTAKRFQRAVNELRFPALARSDMDTLTISGGLAGFPWDGRTPAELLHHADMMALESKRKGKNALTFGSGALRCELPKPTQGDV